MTEHNARVNEPSNIYIRITQKKPKKKQKRRRNFVHIRLRQHLNIVVVFHSVDLFKKQNERNEEKRKS